MRFLAVGAMHGLLHGQLAARIDSERSAIRLPFEANARMAVRRNWPYAPSRRAAQRCAKLRVSETRESCVDSAIDVVGEDASRIGLAGSHAGRQLNRIGEGTVNRRYGSDAEPSAAKNVDYRQP